MKLPESWTKVTLLSKILAIILFVSLPFIGFFLGVKYNSQTTICTQNKSKEQCVENSNLTVLPKRVGWDQITQEYDVYWDDLDKSLRFYNLVFGETKEFSSQELFNVTGQKDFISVFKAYGVNSQKKSLLIIVGLNYVRKLPGGGTTTSPKWVEFSVSDGKITNLPINTDEIIVSGELLYYSNAEYNKPGSVSVFNLANDTIEINFPTIGDNSQLKPIGFSSDGKNLIINCFTSESGDFEQDYYFGSAISCGDYLGNFKTEKLTKIK
jgi:hypothetical protein